MLVDLPSHPNIVRGESVSCLLSQCLRCSWCTSKSVHGKSCVGYEAFKDERNIYLVMELCTGLLVSRYIFANVLNDLSIQPVECMQQNPAALSDSLPFPQAETSCKRSEYLGSKMGFSLNRSHMLHFLKTLFVSCIFSRLFCLVFILFQILFASAAVTALYPLV